MKKLSLEEIKYIELGILKEFAKFCKKYNLTFYLAGGTLLGAVRHQGFIPWDDDIDVCMPRKDYEFFIQHFTCGAPFLNVYANRLGNFPAPYAKIVNIKTTISAKYIHNNIEPGVWIDVFPVDGLPESLEETGKIYKTCNFYRTIYGLTYAKLGEGKTTYRKYSKYILKPLACLYGSQRCVEKIETIARRYSYEQSNYVGVITWGLYGVGERMKKSEFEHAVDVEFEGEAFPAFSCWDSYLTGLYGDYMIPPPLEERKTHDIMVFMKD